MTTQQQQPAPDPQALAKAGQLNQAANRYSFVRKQALAKVVQSVKSS